MADLPDWYTQIQSATLRATSIGGGIDADKSASPVAEDVYLARDTGILYVCFVSGTWTNIGILYLLLAGGTMSGAIAMGSNKITGLGAPTLTADAARKTDVDTVDAKLDDVTAAAPTRALDTVYQNTSGKIRLVAANVYQTGDASSAAGAVAKTDSANPPTTIVGRANLANPSSMTHQVTITFIVQVNHYYTIVSSSTGGGATTLQEWEEWDLF